MWPCVQTVWKLPWAKTEPVLAYWFDCIGPLLAQNSAIIGPILARYKIVCWVFCTFVTKHNALLQHCLVKSKKRYQNTLPKYVTKCNVFCVTYNGFFSFLHNCNAGFSGKAKFVGLHIRVAKGPFVVKCAYQYISM